MARGFPRLCAPALAAILGALPTGGAQASDTPPAHNYVSEDLTWRKPDPLPPPERRYNAVLLDTASVRKSGDIVDFDELILSPSYQAQISPPVMQVAGSTIHYQVTCGWRTMRLVVAGGIHPPSDFSNYRLVSTRPNLNSLVDKACAGRPLDAARGAQSLDEAIAFWKDQFPPPQPGATNTITVQNRVASPSQSPAAWMDSEHPRRFVPTVSADASGNMLFLDRGNLVRDGDTVSAASLVVLGAQSVRPSRDYDPVLELSNSRYDCAARTVTVTAQAFWNRYDVLIRQNEQPLAPRAAGESPVTAADIDAACGGETAGAQSFAKIEDAWAFARAHWPPAEVPAWVVCVWTHYPDDVRAKFFQAWENHAAQPPLDPNAPVPPQFAKFPPAIQRQFMQSIHDQLPGPPLPDAATASTCAAPRGAFLEQEYAHERGALEMLASQHIDEAKIRAAWDAIPWPDQQRFVESSQAINTDTMRMRKDVAGRVADRLGISSSDDAARAQVEYYLVAQAWIENN